MRRVAILSLAAALMLAACGAPTTTETIVPEDESTSRDTRPAPEKTPESVPPPEGEAAIGEVPGELLDQVIASAIADTGVARSDITVTRAESVIWNDGSLGCPEPGQIYTQALVDGYWVELDVAGDSYDYRSTDTGYFRRCTGPSPSAPTG